MGRRKNGRMMNENGKNAAETKPKKRKISKNRLRFRLMITAIVLFVSFSSLVAVTFAWYVYQTGARTSDIRMAVGTGSRLLISNEYDGQYGHATVMDEFHELLEPVSTDSILGGFQKATGFTGGKAGQPMLVANLFGASDTTDYYKTTLYIRVEGEKQNVYLSDIGYEDDDPKNPLSTAIRVGFVVHEPGQDKEKEFIFEINSKEHNPEGQYNTATGEDGFVLDSKKQDGSTILMKDLQSEDNFCNYDKNTGVTTLKENSKMLFTVEGGENGKPGKPVQVDVYVWLEGCDSDCNNNLCGKMLKTISLSFAGITPTE